MTKDGINQGQTQLSQSLPITRNWQDLAFTGLHYINIVRLLVGFTVLQPFTILLYTASTLLMTVPAFLLASFTTKSPAALAKKQGVARGIQKTHPDVSGIEGTMVRALWQTHMVRHT